MKQLKETKCTSQRKKRLPQEKLPHSNMQATNIETIQAVKRDK